MTKVTDFLNACTEDEKAEALGQLYFFPMPKKMFDVWAPLSANTAYEYIIYRGRRGARQLLLYTRASDDPVFGGQLHFPGTLVYPGNTPESIWQRVRTSSKYALKDVELSDPGEPIGTYFAPKGPQSEGKSPREQCQSIIHFSEFIGGEIGQPDGDGVEFGWYTRDEIPLEGPLALVGHHEMILRKYWP